MKEERRDTAGGADAERLHKLRVSLRRLRTLLWAYRPILKEDFDTQHRALLKFLANAAGKTRDWDNLIELVGQRSDPELIDTFREIREQTSKKSRETLANSNLKHTLREGLSEAKRELNAAAGRTPLRKFARQRVITAAQKQLRKRMRVASKGKRTDYASFLSRCPQGGQEASLSHRILRAAARQQAAQEPEKPQAPAEAPRH